MKKRHKIYVHRLKILAKIKIDNKNLLIKVQISKDGQI